MAELKPCPFCGATNEPFGKIMKWQNTKYWMHWRNGCILGGFLIKDVEAWNRRAGETNG